MIFTAAALTAVMHLENYDRHEYHRIIDQISRRVYAIASLRVLLCISSPTFEINSYVCTLDYISRKLRTVCLLVYIHRKQRPSPLWVTEMRYVSVQLNTWLQTSVRIRACKFELYLRRTVLRTVHCLHLQRVVCQLKQTKTCESFLRNSCVNKIQPSVS